MRQSYKLRLGDGTVLVVDHAGLTNWLSDRMALVQPAGAELWTPLRSFLVQEPSAVRPTARHRPEPPPASRRDLPLVPPPLPEAAPEPVTALFPAPPLPQPAPPLPEPPASVLPEPPDQEYEVDLSPCLGESASAPMLTIEREDSAPLAAVAPPTPVETPAQRVASPPSGEEAPSPDGGLRAPSLADEEDVGWMTLPLPPGDEPPGVAAVSWLDTVAPSSLGARPSRLDEGSRPPRARARHALGARGPSFSHGSHSLAGRAWRVTRLRLASLASSSSAALLGLWKSIGPGEHAVTTSLFGELARNPVVGSEAGAPPPHRPPIVASGGRIPAEKRRDPSPAYRPRRSPHDGLPLLQLEPLDEVEASWDSQGWSGARRSPDELPEIVLPPVDARPGAGSTRGQRARR